MSIEPPSTPFLINCNDLSVKTININAPTGFISSVRIDSTPLYFSIEGITKDYIRIKAKDVNRDVIAHTETISVICTVTDDYECTKTFKITQLNGCE